MIIEIVRFLSEGALAFLFAILVGLFVTRKTPFDPRVGNVSLIAALVLMILFSAMVVNGALFLILETHNALQTH